MGQQTELMKSILTNETAQKMIDYVSPLYGNSYVGLWIFQAIGTVLSELCNISNQLLYETNVSTAELLLDYWEKQYGLSTDSSLTIEQRRARITSKKQSRGQCNPAKLEYAVSTALGGVEVNVAENVAQNTFLVNIREPIPSYIPAIAVIERMKPAHLVYQIRVAQQTIADADIRVAIAMTHAEQFKVDVIQSTTPPAEVDGITVNYDDSGIVTLSIPDCTVSHDENGTVTLSGITAAVTHDDNGNVMIGG